MQTEGLRRRSTIVLAAGLFTLACGSRAQLPALGPDVAGGQDTPLVSRYPGAQLIGFQDLGFEQAGFWSDAGTAVPAQGQVARRLYLLPAGKTPMEVHRHYEQALRSAGLQVATATQEGEPAWDVGTQWRANFLQLIFRKPFAADLPPFDRNAYYLYGTYTRGGAVIHVSVLTGNTSPLAHEIAKVRPQDALTAVAIQVIEPKVLQSGDGLQAADAMRRSLDAEGKVVLYGLQFQPGSAELRLESRPQLEQIATLLKQRPQLRLNVVGHTDDAGGFDDNLRLSLARAQAVVAALVRDHGIDIDRLAARGAGSLAPVASNASESGRGRNRRVELVPR
jgi:OOP family OmpA-OmpF porin